MTGTARPDDASNLTPVVRTMGTPALLNGPLAPIGWRIGVIDARLNAVIREVTEWRRRLGQGVSTTRIAALWPSGLHWLEPLESPWSRSLFVEHSDRWTIFLNNHLQSGDPASIVGMLIPRLSCRAFVASYHPMTRTDEALAEFQVYDPFAPAPLHLLRSVAGRAEAGVWEWHATGEAEAFEDIGRYEHPDIAQRLDRPLIAAYLTACGIDIDDAAKYGEAALMTQLGAWARHTLTLDQARAQWGVATES